MATPILTVPVDDAAFKRFLDTFKKYQSALKDQPEMWKSMAGGVDTVAIAAAVITDEIVRQTEKTKELLSEEEKREKAHEAAARRRKKEDDEQDRRDKKAHDARKRSIDQVREYGRSVSDTISGFGKWAAGGGHVGNVVGSAGSALADAAGGSAILAGLGGLLAAGGAALGGSYLLAMSAGNQRRQAQGYGTSMGNLQGYENNLQRYFDVDSTFAKMAAMQNDPTALSTFGMMGIQSKGKDTAQLTKEAALAARRMWIADNKNPALAQAQGLTNIFSIEDLNRLAANSPGDISKSFADADKFAKTSGVSDDSGKKMQDFVVAMDNATGKIKNVLIDGLTKFEPTLERVVKEFGELADDLKYILSFFDKKQASPAGLLTGGAYKNAWDYLGDAVGGGTGAWIKKNMGAEGDTGGDGGSGSGTSGGSIFPKYTGFNPWAKSGGGGGSSGGGGQGGDDVYSFFRQKGYSDSAARGIAAGVFAESGGKHDRFNQQGSGAYGLAQWLTKSRLADFKRSYGHDIYHSTRAEQLAFIDKELRTTESFAGSKISNARSAYEALQAFIHHYERPGPGAHGDLRRGKHYIDRHVKIKVSNQTGSSVATTVHSAAG